MHTNNTKSQRRKTNMDDQNIIDIIYSKNFECYKSNVCHLLKDLGDLKFIERILIDDPISQFVKSKHAGWALYLLATLDYVSKENDIPLCARYDKLRKTRLKELAVPVGIAISTELLNNRFVLEKAYKNAIPEFLKYNILEGDIRNVY